MRLVDADTVVTIQVYDDMTEETDTKKMTIAEAIDEWSDEGCPPTVDAVEVVRCEDCKYCRTWYFDKDGDYLWAICTFWNEDNRVDGIDVYKDGFCSNGKRRIDDETD